MPCWAHRFFYLYPLGALVSVLQKSGTTSVALAVLSILSMAKWSWFCFLTRTGYEWEQKDRTETEMLRCPWWRWSQVDVPTLTKQSSSSTRWRLPPPSCPPVCPIPSVMTAETRIRICGFVSIQTATCWVAVPDRIIPHFISRRNPIMWYSSTSTTRGYGAMAVTKR